MASEKIKEKRFLMPRRGSSVNRSWQRGFETAKAASLSGIAPRTARKVGAALFSGSVLLSLGFNSYGHSHPKARWGVHAEHRALLRRMHFDVRRNLVMYTFRSLADGTPSCSKPCQNCQLLMAEAGVRFVRFIDEKGTPQEARL